MRVYKYQLELAPTHIVEMPQGATIVHVAEQYSHPTIWALVDPDAQSEERSFVIVGTGDNVPESHPVHVGTYFQGPFVWHIFETP